MPYTINYLDNTGDNTVANLPATNSGTTDVTSVVLSNTEPTRFGYTFSKWCLGVVNNNGTTCVGSQYDKGASIDFINQTISGNVVDLYTVWAPNKYNITLNNNDATIAGSTSAYTTYDSSSIYAGTVAASGTNPIAAPERSYTVSGFSTEYNNAADATVSSNATLNSIYKFNGYYTSAAGGNRIITSTGTLAPSTIYTDAYSKWIANSGVTLYSQWDNTVSSAKITLPTITKNGHTCGWSTSSNTNTIMYTSGQTDVVPDQNLVLYGVCTTDVYSVTIRTNEGISKVSLNGVDCTSASGCVVSNLTYGQTYDLSATIVSGYRFASWDAGSYGSIADNTSISTTYTVGAGNSVITPSTISDSHSVTIKTTAGISSVTLNTTECTSTAGCTVSGLISGQTYVLIATVENGYSFTSWTNGSNGTITNTTSAITTYTAGTGNSTITPSATANQYNITLDGNGGTLGSSSTTATYNSNTLTSITNPTRDNSTGTYTVSGFTMGNGADGASITWTSSCISASDCVSTNTTSYTFDGWYKEAAATNKIASAATTPVLVDNTAYTDADGRWTSTSGQTLYAGWTAASGAYTNITLPTISKAGHTCAWNTLPNGAGDSYTSSYELSPNTSGDLTLYGYCTANSYLQTVQVRYQTATGSWGAYTNYDTCTKNVAYGSTHSCSIAATTEYQAATLSGYTVTGAATKQIDVYRNTNTVSLTAGTGVSGVSVTGTGVKTGSGTASATVYYGGTVTIAATMTSGYDWVNWTGSTTYTSQSQAIPGVTSNLAFTANGKVGCQPSISGTMQAFNPSNLCSTVTSGTLTDSRDNQSYTIAKLADGRWWMIDNLNLGATTLSEDLNSANTNLSATITIRDFSSYKKTSGTGSYDIPEYIPVSGIDSTSQTPYGTLYNYCMASAETICDASYSPAATYDICPKGWRLPTGGDSGEFKALYNNSNYNTSAKIRAPLSQGGAAFASAGSFYESEPTGQGGSGTYWSSTDYDSWSMYVLSFNNVNVYPTYHEGKVRGYSIRCILK